MHNTILPLAAVILIAGAGGIWALKSNTDYKPVLPGGIGSDTTREELDALAAQWREEVAPSPRPGSQAVVTETEYDFGMLAPGSVGAHTFTIRNAGTEALLLGDPQTNSDYMEAEFSQRQIEPGDVGQLVVRWQPIHIRSGTYRAAVTLPTSDPGRPAIHFRIRGEIVRRLEAVPGALNFGDIDPRATAGAREAIIGSEVWDTFQILQASCEMDGVTWEFEPATPSELARGNFKGGYRIRVRLPDQLQEGRNVAYLRLSVQPPGEGAAPIDCQLRLAAKVLRRLCVYGDQVDRDGVIDMGLVMRGRGETVLLRVKMRDNNTDLPNARVEVTPSFVHGELVRNEAGGVAGNYLLKITVPPTAPICTHLLPAERGTIRILTDHPRAKEQQLSLRFAVVDNRPTF